VRGITHFGLTETTVLITRVSGCEQLFLTGMEDGTSVPETVFVSE
jgi:hypothetical protein